MGSSLVTDYGGDAVYGALGVLRLDAVADPLHYFAFLADFDAGEDMDGIVVGDKYAAADAFANVTDPYVTEGIGFFATMEEAVQAVFDYVAMRNV